MGLQGATAAIHLFSTEPSPLLISNSSFKFPKPSNFPRLTHFPITATDFLLFKAPKSNLLRFCSSTPKTRANLDKKEQDSTAAAISVQDEEEKDKPSEEVKQSVKVLKNSAKTRRVPPDEVLSALSVIEKAKLDPTGFLETLGGTKSPGRTWMLIFTAEKQLKSGRYFPITAVQRFDAAGKRIENGVYLGPIGSLTFEGRLSWKKRILAFIFERIRIKVGPFNPLEINFGGKDEREPSNKDPFFIWFYIDEEIAVARGRSGGTALWCRCRRVSNF